MGAGRAAAGTTGQHRVQRRNASANNGAFLHGGIVSALLGVAC